MVLLHNIIQILALTETDPTGKNTFFLQRFHGSRIVRVLVHVDHPGHTIAGRAQGLAEEAFSPAASCLAVGRKSMVGRSSPLRDTDICLRLNLYVNLVRAVAFVRR